MRRDEQWQTLGLIGRGAQARAWHQAWLAVGGALNQSGSPSMGEVLAVEEFFELEQRLQRLGLEVSRPAQ